LSDSVISREETREEGFDLTKEIEKLLSDEDDEGEDKSDKKQENVKSIFSIDFVAYHEEDSELIAKATNYLQRRMGEKVGSKRMSVFSSITSPVWKWPENMNPH
jgi:hypothetical protein